MTDQELQDILVALFLAEANGMTVDECWTEVVPETTTFEARTYQDAQVLTSDKGLVLRIEDEDGRQEFQITVLRWR